MSNGIWILSGPAHRQAQFAAIAVGMAERMLTDPDVGDQSMLDPGEEWVCDGCHGTVEQFHRPDAARTGPDPTLLPPHGRLMPIPVLDDEVLCRDCLTRRLGGDLNLAAGWPGCGCDGCVDVAVRSREAAARG
jgi:hypothetical protein